MIPLARAMAISFLDRAISCNNRAIACLCQGQYLEAVALLKVSVSYLHQSEQLFQHHVAPHEWVGRRQPLNLPRQQAAPRKLIRCFACHTAGILDDSFPTYELRGRAGTTPAAASDANSSGDFDCCGWVFLLSWDMDGTEYQPNGEFNPFLPNGGSTCFVHTMGAHEMDFLISCITAAVAYNSGFAYNALNFSMGSHGHNQALALYLLSLNLLETVDEYFHSDLSSQSSVCSSNYVNSGVSTNAMAIASPKDWTQVHVAVLNNIGYICSVFFDWEGIHNVIHRMWTHLTKQFEFAELRPSSAEEGDIVELEDIQGPEGGLSPIGLLWRLDNMVTSTNGSSRMGSFHSPAA
jgi:hypothetical protein